MTIENLYHNILNAQDDIKTLPIFQAYITTYEAWISSPTTESLLEALYKILNDINKYHHTEFSRLSTVPYEELDLPNAVIEPEWITLKNEVLEAKNLEQAPLLIEIQKMRERELNLKPSSDEETENIELPSITTQLKNFASSMKDFAASGFKTVTKEQYEHRKKICEGCKFFDPAGFGGMGRCRKCGCSTYKLDIAASRCPMGFWESIK